MAGNDTPEARLRAFCDAWGEVSGGTDAYGINQTRLTLADLRAVLDEHQQMGSMIAGMLCARAADEMFGFPPLDRAALRGKEG